MLIFKAADPFEFVSGLRRAKKSELTGTNVDSVNVWLRWKSLHERIKKSNQGLLFFSLHQLQLRKQSFTLAKKISESVLRGKGFYLWFLAPNNLMSESNQFTLFN